MTYIRARVKVKSGIRVKVITNTFFIVLHMIIFFSFLRGKIFFFLFLKKKERNVLRHYHHPLAFSIKTRLAVEHDSKLRMT